MEYAARIRVCAYFKEIILCVLINSRLFYKDILKMIIIFLG